MSSDDDFHSEASFDTQSQLGGWIIEVDEEELFSVANDLGVKVGNGFWFFIHSH